MRIRLLAAYGALLAVWILVMVFAVSRTAPLTPAGGDRYSAMTLSTIIRVRALTRPRAMSTEIVRSAHG